MPLLKFRNILSCSSEDQIHCAENLLKPEQYKKWLSAKSSDERITCIIEFEKSSSISSVDIGNDGSAFIELLVSRSSSSNPDDWTVLLAPTLLMSPSESRSNQNRNRVKILKSSDLNKTCLNEKWDRLKIVCEQKFNRLNPFGLCFIKLQSPATLADETNQSEILNKSSVDINDDEDDETEKEQHKIGSFFAKKQAEKSLKISSEPTASDQIRALSNVADELLSQKPMDDKEIKTLLKKDVQNTPTRLSKRRMSDEVGSSTNENEAKRNKKIDKSQLMKNVSFVLSGFKNPLRSELRDKAMKMGATYQDDWNKKCTHLICAFPNTPKFQEVQQTRKGSIVDKQWILDCYDRSQLLSEKNYELKGSNNNERKTNTPSRISERTSTKVIHSNENDDDDEEENEKPIISKDVTRKTPIKRKMTTFDDEDDDDDDEDELPVVSKNVKQKSKSSNKIDDDDIYNVDTDEDEPSTTKKSFELANFFHDKHFYVFDGEFDNDTLYDIRRVIYAYDGILEKQLTSGVNYIITNQLWNEHFEKALKTNPDTKFLTLDWLQDCHDENKLVPYKPYLILLQK